MVGLSSRNLTSQSQFQKGFGHDLLLNLTKIHLRGSILFPWFGWAMATWAAKPTTCRQGTGDMGRFGFL